MGALCSSETYMLDKEEYKKQVLVTVISINHNLNFAGGT